MDRDLHALELCLTVLEDELFPRWVELAHCEAAVARLGRGASGIVLLERGEMHPGRRIMRLRRRWWACEDEKAASFDLVAAGLHTMRWTTRDPEVVRIWEERCANGWGAQAATGLGAIGAELSACAEHLGELLFAQPAVRLRWEGWIDAVEEGATTALVRWLGRVGCTYAALAPQTCVLNVPEPVGGALAGMHSGTSLWTEEVSVAALLEGANENERKG
jgi:hypothetical protein